MSTKISFFLPVLVVESEMGLCTAAEEMVFLLPIMPPPVAATRLSTAMGSLCTYSLSVSVLVLCG